jgi:putative transposase
MGTNCNRAHWSNWAYRRGIQLDFIRPGNLWKMPSSKWFNGRFRDECLNGHQFVLLADAQVIIEAWWRNCNHSRPHSSLGHLTPNESVMQRQVIWTAEEVVCSD